MNKQTKKNRQKQGFIFLMLCFAAIMAMAWGCGGDEPAPKPNTKASVTSAKEFSEAAAIHIPGRTETFRGQNTLISFMPQEYREEGLQYASILPFRLPLIFAQANPSILISSPFTTPVDTSMARIRYIVRNASDVSILSYDTNTYDYQEWVSVSVVDFNKDTVNGRIIFYGQDILQQNIANGPYMFARYGKGGFNALVRTAATRTTYDTMGYIPNRLTARLYWKLRQFFPKGEYDSCMYYMYKLLKFYPLNNGSQYWELVNSGAEPRLDSDEKIKVYLDKVKAEEGL